MLNEKQKSFSDLSVAVQGFANVGSNAARLIAEQGAKIVAVADYAGGVENPEGLDIPALIKWCRASYDQGLFRRGTL